MNSEQDIIEELELCGCKNAIEVFKEFENSLEYYEDNEIYNKHGNLIKKYNYKKKKFRKSFFFSLASLLYRGVINEETDEAFSWLNDTIYYNIMLEGNYDHFPVSLGRHDIYGIDAKYVFESDFSIYHINFLLYTTSLFAIILQFITYYF